MAFWTELAEVLQHQAPNAATDYDDIVLWLQQHDHHGDLVRSMLEDPAARETFNQLAFALSFTPLPEEQFGDGHANGAMAAVLLYFADLWRTAEPSYTTDLLQRYGYFLFTGFCLARRMYGSPDHLSGLRSND